MRSEAVGACINAFQTPQVVDPIWLACAWDPTHDPTDDEAAMWRAERRKDVRRTLLVITSVALVALGVTPVAAQSLKIECGASHAAADDPIVFPGQPGAAHLHEFFGNTSTNASSTYASMLGKPTTCPFAGDTAGYWIPALFNSSDRRIPARRMTVYYRDRPVESRVVTPFPPDFRMIAGAPTAGVWGFNCDGNALNRSVLIDCSGQTAGHTFVRATVIFPNCGKRDALGNIVKDSPDHRSHVAYPVSARVGCPAAFPVQLPHVKVNVRYDISNCIRAGCHLSSDHMSPCNGNGCSLHADFWNTWNQAALVNMVNTKLN